MRPLAAFFFLASVACYAQTATLTNEAAPAENPLVRAEAVRLMEQANRISTPTTWPANEQSIHFRIGQPEPGQPAEGDYTSDIGAPGQRRQEWRYGTYSQAQVRNGNAFTILHAEGVSPGFIPLIAQLAPAWHGHFDEEDIVRSIVDTGDGRRCIQFITSFGDRRQQQNEACINVQNGWLESIRLGDKTIRNSNFFAFGSAFLPGHVEQSVGDAMVMALDQTIATKDYPPDFFGTPRMSKGCAASTRPSPIDNPQPAPQTVSMNVIDIVLNGIVNAEGRVTNLKPLDNLRPDLNQEALDLVSKWTFAAGTCDGKPSPMWISAFVVHFKGR